MCPWWCVPMPVLSAAKGRILPRQTVDRPARVFWRSRAVQPLLYTRKMAPIFLPSSALAERIVSVSSSMAQTPRALAM